MKKIRKLLFYAFMLLLGVLLYNTFTFSSRQITIGEVFPVSAPKGAEQRLSEAIKIPTISHQNSIDTAAFQAFNKFLDSTYRNIDTLLEKKVINGYSRIYHWPGRKSALPPVLMIAHLDVVPTKESEMDWEVPPFSGAIKDGFIWGRGSMDDKISALGILEAVDMLLKENYQPERSFYMAFGHDEETNATGAIAMSQYFKEQNIRFEYVIDEGMVAIEGAVPNIDKPVALIGLAEKGFLTLHLSTEQDGGHSSMPPKQTAIGIISAAVSNLEANPLPASLKGPTRELFEYTGPEMAFPLRMVMANLWLFGGVVKSQMSNKNTTNAALRTTTAVTLIDGGIQNNVLPTKAEATINFRIRPGETVESVTQMVTKLIDDERVTIEAIGKRYNPSSVSSTNGFGFQVIQRTIKETFPEALIAPSLVLATTDSRHYDEVAENVYRFLPVRLKNEDLKRIHGINERISEEGYRTAIAFYYRLIKSSTN